MSWSYSKLSSYEQCPSKKKFKYDDKIEMDTPKSEVLLRGSSMHGDVEHNIHRTTFEVPEWMRPHMPHIEKYANGMKETKIWLGTDWAPIEEYERDLITILDLLYLDAPNATVIDWKTGKRYPNHIDQLELYALSVLAQYDDIDIVEARAYYLDEKPGSWSNPVFVARSNFDAVRTRWDERVGMMDVDTECAPRTGWYCRFCDYRKSNAGPCAFG